MEPTVSPEDLVGSWDLEAFEVRMPDGKLVTPMGPDARGRLIYGADGRMSATLSEADRPQLSVHSLEAYGKASVAQKAAAFGSFLSYVGRYALEGETVVHDVELASVPNIVGRQQRRHATLDGDVLTLSYAVRGSRGTRTNILRWRRL